MTGGCTWDLQINPRPTVFPQGVPTDFNKSLNAKFQRRRNGRYYLAGAPQLRFAANRWRRPTNFHTATVHANANYAFQFVMDLQVSFPNVFIASWQRGCRHGCPPQAIGS